MPRRLPPIWLMGLANLPFSISSTILLITVPQLLAARHVPEPRIAAITAFALVPGFAVFLVAPVLDVRFSRRTYAIATALASAALTLLALLRLDDLNAVKWLLFSANVASNLYQGALGGWLGSLVPTEEESRLGAWFTVANIAGFGLDAVFNITLIRALPAPFGTLCVVSLIVLPLSLFLFFPAPGSDRRLAQESFRTFGRDILALVQRPTVIRTLLIFVTPAACFSLTNMLGGVGADFSTPEKLVGVVAGVGVTIAGLFGSLIVPSLTRRFSPYLLYLVIGVVGAVFTLILLALGRTPATFAIAMVGENIGQAAAFATANTIIFHEIGKGNPLAATEFTLLTSAVLLPLTYMQWADGRGYALSGLRGAFLTDGGLGLAGCAAIALLLLFARRAARERRLSPGTSA